MRILICGGRNFADLSTPIKGSPEWRQAMEEYSWGIAALDKMFKDDKGVSSEEIIVISGMARGADTLAADWADINFFKLDPYPITKEDWKTYGLGAGSRRNSIMLNNGKPDLVVAFPGKNGTADMIRQSIAAGVEVRELRYEPKHGNETNAAGPSRWSRQTKSSKMGAAKRKT